MATPAPTGSVITYRYLRVAMIVLVVGLAAAVLRELAAVGFDCAQDSISSYYYTPAQAVFVGVLVAIGVCLVVIKGSTDVEDVLLNLAGMLAPVVAFVPTPYVAACYSTPVDTGRVQANVANNMLALLVMGLAALVVGWFMRRAGGQMDHRVFVVGTAVSVVIFVVFGLVFFVARDFFVSAAHYGAAVPMFGCMVAVAAINAWYVGQTTQDARRRTYWANRYALIAWGMLATIAVGALLGFGLGWEHWLLGVETVLIALFAVFWGLQTKQLWDRGLWYGEGRVALRDLRPPRLVADPDALEVP